MNLLIRLLPAIFAAAVAVEAIAVLVATNSDGPIQALAVLLAIGVGLLLLFGILAIVLTFLGAAALVGFIELLTRSAQPNTTSSDQPNNNRSTAVAPHREHRRRRTITWD